MSETLETVLLTGGTGLAGSAVLRELLATRAGIRVRIPYRSEDGLFISDPRVEYVRANLFEASDCARVVAGCEFAIHTAAQTGGAHQTSKMPWLQVTPNIVADTLLLQALYDAKVMKLIYISSATVYQNFSGIISENQLNYGLDPQTIHFGVGWAKRSAEKLCRFWHEVGGMKIIVVRPSNIYGPAAQFLPQNSNFIAALVRKAVDKMDPFEVWGSPDIERNILYADDFGKAVVDLMNYVDIGFDVFNLGSGENVKVSEIVELVLRYSGHTPSKTLFSELNQMAIQRKMLDCTKIIKLLGWSPITTPEVGIQKTIKWWLENKDSWKK